MLPAVVVAPKKCGWTSAGFIRTISISNFKHLNLDIVLDFRLYNFYIFI